MPATPDTTPPTETNPWVDLLDRVRRGDSGAETQFVRRFSSAVYNVLYARLRDQEAAHDLAQEVFIVALSRIREGQIDPARIGQYLRQTAVNLATSHQRKLSIRKAEPITDTIVDSAALPEAARDREQTVLLVRSLISALPIARDRELIYRYYIDGDSAADIARDLAIDKEHFDRVLHRARERFKVLVNSSGTKGV